MSPNRSSPTNQSTDSETSPYFRRRQFMALGASTGMSFLTGCAGEEGLSPSTESSPTRSTDSAATTSGTFRLLISDQPAAIGDFEELNVSFDRARIFRGEGTNDDGIPPTEIPTGTEMSTETDSATDTPTATVTETRTATSTVTNTATDTGTQTEEDKSDNETQKGFFVIDLDGTTVDLTQVIGDKAIDVFKGELPEGQYTKIELYADSVEGIVDGNSVDVMIPSGKLQIVKPFEVTAGETLSFVFDINVVKKGKTGKYNLLPVISKSGVVGKEVEVERVENGNSGSRKRDQSKELETEDEQTEITDDQEDEKTTGRGQGPPDNPGDSSS